MSPSLVYTCDLKNDCIVVQQQGSPHYKAQKLTINFKRTIRVPDNAEDAKLPPGLGDFGLFKARDFAAKLPADIATQGGIFLTMYQREAMWVNFRANYPFMIKMYAGGVNVVSGEHSMETMETKMRRRALVAEGKSIQDYVVVPRQMWIDGFAVAPGVVRQFVAMPLGMGYSVEAQLTGKEKTGGIQFEITPSLPPRRIVVPPHPISGQFSVIVSTLTGHKFPVYCSSSDTVHRIKEYICDAQGTPIDEQRLIHSSKQLEDGRTLSDYNIRKSDTIHMVLRLRGGALCGPMGVAAGGKIEQVIHKDRNDPKVWIPASTITIPVHILTTAMFRDITGMKPPNCPISASTYADAGFPFFHLPEESSGVSGAFDGVKSVNQMKVERGLASGEEPNVKPPVTTIRPNEDATANSWVNLDTIEDPHGLVNPNGPLRAFRDLESLISELNKNSEGSE